MYTRFPFGSSNRVWLDQALNPKAQKSQGAGPLSALNPQSPPSAVVRAQLSAREDSINHSFVINNRPSFAVESFEHQC